MWQTFTARNLMSSLWFLAFLSTVWTLRLEAENWAYRAFARSTLFLTDFIKSAAYIRDGFFFYRHCEYLPFWMILPAITEIAATSRPVTQYDARFNRISTMSTAIHTSNIVIMRRRCVFSRYSSALKWSSGWFTGPIEIAPTEKNSSNNWMIYFPSRKWASRRPNTPTKSEKKKHPCSVLQW